MSSLQFSEVAFQAKVEYLGFDSKIWVIYSCNCNTILAQALLFIYQPYWSRHVINSV